MIKGPFEIVKLPPEHERSIVGAWKIDFPGVPMTRTIELVAGQYYLVSRLLDKDGARVGGEDGLLLQKVSENEYRGTGKNQSTYKLTADGRFEQFVVGDREPSMVGSPTDQLWPQLGITGCSTRTPKGVRAFSAPALLAPVNSDVRAHGIPIVIERTWFTQTPDGKEFEIAFRVAAPVREPGGEWSAEASLMPVETGRKIYGEDGWQAASLALRFLAGRAQDYSERGWKFFWTKGGEEATSDELMV